MRSLSQLSGRVEKHELDEAVPHFDPFFCTLALAVRSRDEMEIGDPTMKTHDLVKDFSAQDQDGNSVRLSGLLEGGPVVLFFYPKAMTPGWTIESGHFRDLASEFKGLGAQRVGISADRVNRQKAFDEKNNLGFPLLSDTDREIAKIFGVRRFGLLPNKRATFVIGTDRKVLGVINSELDMTGHADKALKVLRSALR
jgi:peroxiredoxin Q/BCP